MLDVLFWIAEGFLAMFFLAAGVPKVLNRGIDRWVGFEDVPRPLTILIGLCEVVAAVALVVPLLVDELEWTTSLAAIGIAMISLMASGFHVRAREWLPAIETSLWATLAGTIAVGRWEYVESDGPSPSDDFLALLAIALVVAIVINLVVLFSRPVDPSVGAAPEPEPATL